MEFVIVRHGDALALSDDGSDFSRHLSDEGREACKNAALNLKSSNFTPNLIVSSPLIRAVETAEVFSDVFNKCKIIKSDILKVESVAKKTVEGLKSYGDKNIIVITHMPLISDIVYILTKKDIHFKTSSYVHIKKVEEKFEIVSKYNL